MNNKLIEFIKKLFRNNIIFSKNKNIYNFKIKETTIQAFINDRLATTDDHINHIKNNLDTYLSTELIKIINEEKKPIVVFPVKYRQQLNNNNIDQEKYEYKKILEIIIIDDVEGKI